jgi:hypothetical protein
VELAKNAGGLEGTPAIVSQQPKSREGVTIVGIIIVIIYVTSFFWWRGWSHIGELTFLQRQRNRGLELTDRGQWVQHRIVCTKSPQ